MPSYNCRHPTCGTILPEPGYCPVHKPTAAPSHAAYDHYQRDPWCKRFYSSSQWLKARARQLARFPMCQESGCRSLAMHVHHKRAVKEIRFTEPRLLVADENLESVCIPCHNRIEKQSNAQAC